MRRCRDVGAVGSALVHAPRTPAGRLGWFVRFLLLATSQSIARFAAQFMEVVSYCLDTIRSIWGVRLALGLLIACGHPQDGGVRGQRERGDAAVGSACPMSSERKFTGISQAAL